MNCTKTKVLLIGGTSTLADDFYASFSHRLDITRTSRRDSGENTVFLDLLESSTYGNIDGNYDCAIVFAGLTNIDTVNSNKELAYKINYLALIDLLFYLDNLSIRFLFVSSSAVFSNSSVGNTELSTARPDTYYGYLKMLVEKVILSEFKSCAISRVTKVLNRNSVFYSWNNSLRLSQAITPFSNLNVSPVHSSQYSRYLFDWCNSRWSGIAHVSADMQTTYFSLAKHVFDQVLYSDLIKKGTYSQAQSSGIYMPVDARLICSNENSRSFSLAETCKLLKNEFSMDGY